MLFVKNKGNYGRTVLMCAAESKNGRMIKFISQFLIELYNKGLVTKDYISQFVNCRDEWGLTAYHHWCLANSNKRILDWITDIPELNFSIPTNKWFDPGRPEMLGSDLYIDRVDQLDHPNRKLRKYKQTLLKWEAKRIVKSLPPRN